MHHRTFWILPVGFILNSMGLKSIGRFWTLSNWRIVTLSHSTNSWDIAMWRTHSFWMTESYSVTVVILPVNNAAWLFYMVWDDSKWSNSRWMMRIHTTLRPENPWKIQRWMKSPFGCGFLGLFSEGKTFQVVQFQGVVYLWDLNKKNWAILSQPHVLEITLAQRTTRVSHQYHRN